MAKQGRSKSAVAVPRPRPGEGVNIDVSLLAVPGTDGKAKAIMMDLSKAKVPDRRYAADVCAIRGIRGTVKIMFGQERVDGNGWRTLLVIEMSEMAVSRFLESCDEMKNPSYDEIVSHSRYKAEALSTNVSEPSQPNQAASLFANLGLVAISDNESCIDFYHASAFSLGAVPHTHKMAVDPVVRIDLRSTLLFGLITGLRDLAIPGVAAMTYATLQTGSSAS
jgi:hypothetical protein